MSVAVLACFEWREGDNGVDDDGRRRSSGDPEVGLQESNGHYIRRE